jgi:nucleoside phosphorylase
MIPESSDLDDNLIDFVIVTALEEELNAVLGKLPEYKRHNPSGDDIRVYYSSKLKPTFPDGSTGVYEIVVMPLLGMGRVQAATATTDAIRKWNPRYILLVGIAGGVAARDVNLGDILIVDQIIDYELQKLTPEGPEIRWDVQRADPRLLLAAKSLGDSWRELITTPRPESGDPIRHIGPIASGDKVVAFSDALARYRDTWSKLIGVEMEAAGVATAAFQAANAPGFFMVRGVSDLADDNKESETVKKWRSYACDVAASYAVALLNGGPVLARTKATAQRAALIQPTPSLTTGNLSSNVVPNNQSDNILIVAVTKVEVQAILKVFSQAAGEKWTRWSIGNKIYYNLGIHGGAPVFMVQSEMGAATPGGALLTVHQAIQDLHPQAAIMCGIAFGLHPDKQHLGDILVSKQLQYYEPQKVDLQRGQMPRGDRATATERLLDRFRSGDIDWQGTQVYFGLVVSGEKLINDPTFRDWLLETEPEAMGGEMEGAGLYVAARDAKVDWILVKAICDWADGTKNDNAQSLAADNAAQFILHVIRLGGWSRSEQLRTKKFASASPKPFIYGRALQPEEFLNREAELRSLFSRLRSAQSTAIVGEPHIGKTSLLLKLADERTQQVYLEDDAQSILVSYLDLQPIADDYSPRDFWEDALEPLWDCASQWISPHHYKEITETDYTRRALVRLFKNQLGDNERRLVLLLDEFERLLFHPNFQSPSFFALLRSLASRTSGLVLVTASRMSIAEMNDHLCLPGSELFNFMNNMSLFPFTESATNNLLRRAGDAFSPYDYQFIRRIAGRHPFLLQAMAATLLETTGKERYAHAARRFYDQIACHFDSLWHGLDDHARTASIMLSLLELGGRVLANGPTHEELEQANKISLKLREMAEQGLVEQVEEGWPLAKDRLLSWQGEWWTVGSQAFAWWIRDVVVAKSRLVSVYDAWLANRRYRSLLTQEQWEGLINSVLRAPQWVVYDIEAMATALIEELMRRNDQ